MWKIKPLNSVINDNSYLKYTIKVLSDIFFSYFIMIRPYGELSSTSAPQPPPSPSHGLCSSGSQSLQTGLPSNSGAHSYAFARQSRQSVGVSHLLPVLQDRCWYHWVFGSLRPILCSEYNRKYLVKETVPFFLQLLKDVLQPFELCMQFLDASFIVNQMTLGHFVLIRDSWVVLVESFVTSFKLSCLGPFVVLKLLTHLV